MDEDRGVFIKVVISVVEAVILELFIYPFFVDNGACDWRRLWITAEIPSGATKVHL